MKSYRSRGRTVLSRRESGKSTFQQKSASENCGPGRRRWLLGQLPPEKDIYGTKGQKALPQIELGPHFIGARHSGRTDSAYPMTHGANKRQLDSGSCSSTCRQRRRQVTCAQRRITALYFHRPTPIGSNSHPKRLLVMNVSEFRRQL